MDPVTASGLAGVAAGFAIAMPLGAIGVLLLREGMLNGRRSAMAGAAGVATIDALYCTTAILVGAVAAPVIRSWGAWPRYLAGAILVVLGVQQLLALRKPRNDAAPVRGSGRSTYLKFFALTAINPATLIYFLALASALPDTGGPWGGIAFTVGVGLASLSWQLGLALVSSGAGALLPERASAWLGVIGSAVIVVLGLGVAFTG
jgi:threonine/homoserine/homoserine lactone efflux protein